MKTCVGMLAVSVFCVIGATAMAGDKPGENANKGAKRAEKIAERKEARDAKHDARMAERKEARDAKHDARMAEWQKRHDAFIANLTARLANNKKLTDAEKTDIVAFFEKQYKENVTFRSEQHDENMKFFDTLIGGTDTTAEQIKAQLKAHFAKQKGENQEHRATQQAERKAEREKIKAEKKDGAGAAIPEQ
jgi:hypothetical protein